MTAPTIILAIILTTITAIALSFGFISFVYTAYDIIKEHKREPTQQEINEILGPMTQTNPDPDPSRYPSRYS